MTKAKLSKVLFFLSCVLLPAIAVHAQQYKTYKDTIKHFSVSLPETWNFIPEYKDAWFLAHRQQQFKGESKIENVVLATMDDSSAKSMDEDYFSATFSAKARDSSLVIEKESEKGKSNYRWFISTYEGRALHEKIKKLTVVYFINRQIFVLQCTASPKTFDSYRDIFLKIADSIRFK